ncbi:hypothetical protein [Catellatospora chokoriensis]|nr:hypothetical protein [Catellatospora chokoriensis]
MTLLVVSPSPDTYALSPKLESACPSATVRVTRVTYVGASSNVGKLTRYASVSRSLTGIAGVFVPEPSRPDTCQARLTVTLAGSSSLPASVPNPIPRMAATGGDDEVYRYWGDRGVALLDVTWAEPNCG